LSIREGRGSDISILYAHLPRLRLNLWLGFEVGGVGEDVLVYIREGLSNI